MISKVNEAGINKAYLEQATMNKIRHELQQSEFPSVSLTNFFTGYARIKQDLLRLYFVEERKLTSHSYGYAVLPPSLQKLFRSAEFNEFLTQVLGKVVISTTALAYRFGWKDYTILHDERQEVPGIDLIIDFTDEWDERAGGKIRYKDQEGNFISLPLGGNILAIVRREKGVQKFVQYVNHYAGKRNRLLVMGNVKV